MSKSYTIRDVAKEAGVGVGTVSRVLNDSPAVSERTREKVLAAIEALDFRPSPVARRLSVGGRSLAIGIVVPFFTRPAFVGRLQGIEAAIAHSDYDLILYNVETPEQRDNLFRRIPHERRVDGLIIISLRPSDEAVNYFGRFGVPVVLLDAEHPDLTSINIDDVDGGRQAAEHLIELGHQKIAYISDDLDSPFGFVASSERFKGFRQALVEHDIVFRDDYHQQGEHGRFRAHHLTQELMRLDDPPTAIFAASDTQALGVIEAIRQIGLRVPEDVSVVGYDDIEVAAYMGLTTINQSLYQTGVEGVNALLKLLEENTSVKSYSLPVSMVVRNTTAAAPKA